LALPNKKEVIAIEKKDAKKKIIHEQTSIQRHIQRRLIAMQRINREFVD